jgi:hypothetical protein
MLTHITRSHARKKFENGIIYGREVLKIGNSTILIRPVHCATNTVIVHYAARRIRVPMSGNAALQNRKDATGYWCYARYQNLQENSEFRVLENVKANSKPQHCATTLTITATPFATECGAICQWWRRHFVNFAYVAFFFVYF